MSRQDDSTEQLELVTWKLDCLQKKCDDYKETIAFLANEMRNLRESLSDNICQHCKSKFNRTNFKGPEPVTTRLSVCATASPPSLKAATSSFSQKSNISVFTSRHSPQSGSSSTTLSATSCSATSWHIAAPGGSAASPSQVRFPSPNNIVNIAPAISFNSTVKKELDVKLTHSFKHEKAVHCVRFSRDGRQLAVSCGRVTHIYDVETWKLVCALQDISQKPKDKDKDIQINGVSFCRDGIYLAAASDDRLIRVWEISRRRVRSAFKGHQRLVRCLDFCPNGRLLASASSDGTVQTWSLRDGTARVLANTGYETYRSFYSVAFSPDGMYVAAGGQDQVLGIWDVQTGQLVKWLEGHTHSVLSLSFTPDGKGLVSASWDQSLKYWDTGSLVERQLRLTREDKLKQKKSHLSYHEGPKQKGMQSLRDFGGHTNYVYSVAISSNGRWIASGSWDKSVRIWDARNANLQCVLRVHDGYVLSVDFSRRGNYLASLDHDGYVRIWSCEEI